MFCDIIAFIYSILFLFLYFSIQDGGWGLVSKNAYSPMIKVLSTKSNKQEFENLLIRKKVKDVSTILSQTGSDTEYDLELLFLVFFQAEEHGD